MQEHGYRDRRKCDRDSAFVWQSSLIAPDSPCANDDDRDHGDEQRQSHDAGERRDEQ